MAQTLQVPMQIIAIKDEDTKPWTTEPVTWNPYFHAPSCHC